MQTLYYARRKPRAMHVDTGYASTDASMRRSLARLMAANGRDLYDRTTAERALAGVAQPDTRKVIDRYAMMADPSYRAEFRAFKQRQRAARAAA